MKEEQARAEAVEKTNEKLAKALEVVSKPAALAEQQAKAKVDAAQLKADAAASKARAEADAAAAKEKADWADATAKKRAPVSELVSAAPPPPPPPSPAPAEGAASHLDDYRAVVAADAQIKIPGPVGELRVWIGPSAAEPKFDTGMAVGEETIPAKGNTAKVTPFAPDFDVAPKESLCERIDPTGSQVRFQLTPKGAGKFKVGADVALYASNDCTGAAIPKTAATILVEVVVDTRTEVKGLVEQIASATWKAFLAFWDKLLALLFGVCLFLMRRRIFRWLGIRTKTTPPET